LLRPMSGWLTRPAKLTAWTCWERTRRSADSGVTVKRPVAPDSVAAYCGLLVTTARQARQVPPARHRCNAPIFASVVAGEDWCLHQPIGSRLSTDQRHSTQAPSGSAGRGFVALNVRAAFHRPLFSHAARRCSSTSSSASAVSDSPLSATSAAPAAAGSGSSGTSGSASHAARLAAATVATPPRCV
jgi:hypothetical protein